MLRRGLVVFGLLALAIGVGAGCGGFRPYRRMAQAQSSVVSVPTQAHDQELQMQLRRAVVENQALGAFGITPAVYMGHGFLVGTVDDPGQADAILAAGRSVSGLRSLQSYLPLKAAEGSMTGDAELTASVKAGVVTSGLPISRYDVKTLGGVVVLLGVVEDSQESARVESIATAAGASRVVNFLLLVEAGEGSLRPHLR